LQRLVQIVSAEGEEPCQEHQQAISEASSVAGYQPARGGWRLAGSFPGMAAAAGSRILAATASVKPSVRELTKLRKRPLLGST